MTMAPSWEAWEPLLRRHGYRLCLFRRLNRYTSPRNTRALAAPARGRAGLVSDGVTPFRQFKPALDRRQRIPITASPGCWPDADMVRLPLMSLDAMAVRLMLTALIRPSPDRPARPIRCCRCPSTPVRAYPPRRIGPKASALAPNATITRSLPQCGRYRRHSGPPAAASRRATPGNRLRRIRRLEPLWLAACMAPFAIALDQSRL